MENRTGKQWNEEEEIQLRNEYRNKMNIKKIAELHGRSEMAVHLRMCKIIVEKLNEEENEEEIEEKKEKLCKRYNINIKDLDDYLKKNTEKNVEKNNKIKMKDLYDMIKKLDEKINKILEILE